MRTHSHVQAHRGFMITFRGPAVLVWDPSCPYDPAIFRTASLDDAMNWIDDYCSGRVEVEYEG